MIAEEDALLRKAFIALVNEDPKLQVVGQCANLKEMQNLISNQSAEIVIIDLDMLTPDGWNRLDFFTVINPLVKVIVVSSQIDTEFLEIFSGKGIHSYLTKSCAPETLFEAIHSVHERGYYYDEVLVKKN